MLYHVSSSRNGFFFFVRKFTEKKCIKCDFVLQKEAVPRSPSVQQYDLAKTLVKYSCALRSSSCAIHSFLLVFINSGGRVQVFQKQYFCFSYTWLRKIDIVMRIKLRSWGLSKTIGAGICKQAYPIYCQQETYIYGEMAFRVETIRSCFFICSLAEEWFKVNFNSHFK